MSIHSRNRKRRWRDFQRRAKHAPESVTAGPYGRYIAVHALGDEQDLLHRLQVRSEDCIGADAYWQVGEDIVFLEAHCLESLPSVPRRGPGLYVRFVDDRDPPMVHCVAVFDRPYLVRADLEGAMREFVRRGVHRMRATRRSGHPPPPLLPMGAAPS